jgi:O-methyltransferase
MPKDLATQVEELKARLKVVSEINLTLKSKVASLTSKSDARFEFQAKYEELRRHYQLSGLGKKVDISTLPDFAPIARRLMDEGRIGMHFDRLYTLWQGVTAAPDAPAVAEVGSYKGGSSKFIAETLKALGRSPRFYVCDTFAGHARVDPDIDGVTNDDGFKDTSAESVAAYLAEYPNVEMVVGDIFESSARLAGETAFGFVHIDVDVYPPTAFCLDFFSTRLAPGAWMVVDDYGVVTCPGAQKAVDDFVRDNPTFSKVHLLTGQALVFRAG